MSDSDIRAIGAEIDGAAAMAQRDATIATQDRTITNLRRELDMERARAIRLQSDLDAVRAQLEAKIAEAFAPRPLPPEEAPPPAWVHHEVRMAKPYGFIEDKTHRHRQWAAGDVITNRREIWLLMERGAPMDVIKPGENPEGSEAE